MISISCGLSAICFFLCLISGPAPSCLPFPSVHSALLTGKGWLPLSTPSPQTERASSTPALGRDSNQCSLFILVYLVTWCRNGIRKAMVGPPVTRKGFPYAVMSQRQKVCGDVTKAKGMWVGGRCMIGLTSRLKDQKETSPDPWNKGRDGSRGKNLEELLPQYPWKTPLKIKAQTGTSHLRCVLEKILFP